MDGKEYKEILSELISSGLPLEDICKRHNRTLAEVRTFARRLEKKTAILRLTAWCFFPIDLPGRKCDAEKGPVKYFKLSYVEYVKYWESIRTYIAQENTVLNFRTTWTILLQSAVFTGSISLLKDQQAILAALGDNFWYNMLFHVIADASLVLGCALFVGVLATTKTVRNLVKDWQELRSNVELTDSDQEKLYLVPPVYSGPYLYRFSLIPRTTVAITCGLIGLMNFALASACERQVSPSFQRWESYLGVGNWVAFGVGCWMVGRSSMEFLRIYNRRHHHDLETHEFVF